MIDMETFLPGDLPITQTSIPSDYAASLETMAPGIGNVVADTQAPGESWMDSITRLLPVLASTYQQKQLLAVQVERAKAGLPPLDVSQYAAGVNVGISPDTQKLIMYGGVALLAVVWMMSRGRS